MFEQLAFSMSMSMLLSISRKKDSPRTASKVWSRETREAAIATSRTQHINKEMTGFILFRRLYSTLKFVPTSLKIAVPLFQIKLVLLSREIVVCSYR